MSHYRVKQGFNYPGDTGRAEIDDVVNDLAEEVAAELLAMGVIEHVDVEVIEVPIINADDPEAPVSDAPVVDGPADEPAAAAVSFPPASIKVKE